MAKIQLSDAFKKYIRITAFLLISGILGWVLAAYVVNNEALVAIFAPAINFTLYFIKTELDKDGIVEALKN